MNKPRNPEVIITSYSLTDLERKHAESNSLAVLIIALAAGGAAAALVVYLLSRVIAH